jgi:pimeloyl-ACP methyl ester carboxylesterase
MMYGNTAGALPQANTIEFSNCTLTLPGTTGSTVARCGWLEVPENPAAPEARQIRLHVALAPAAARVSRPDPLFFFAGGPGQSASEAWVMLRPILEKIRKDRDIVLIDQRGTGKSNPLKCPIEEGDALETSVDPALISRLTRQCLEDLDADPRFYTTTIAMQDYDQVRRAMGYERINLLGISYGTRSSQVYLRHYPEHVRSVILDSVVPMELALGQEHGQMLDRAIGIIFADCRLDQQCAEQFGSGAGDLRALIRQLREHPRDISFTHPYTGKQESLTVTADVLAFAIRFLSYSSQTQAVLPLLVHEAITTGNLNRLATQAMLIGGTLSEQISRGMELSVICSEDYPHMVMDEATADTLLGATMLQVLHTACGIWPQGAVPDDFHQPVTAETPVLLLAGTRDPVTPPVYAERTALHYPDSLVLIAPGLGHSVSTNPCIRDISAAFIDRGTLANLDTRCVRQIRPAPFFTSILGPNP